MPTYTSNDSQSVHAEQGVLVTAGGGDRIGGRLIFQSYANWALVKGAGKIGYTNPGDPGIYTTGQLQCMGVIAAKFGPHGWSACLVHVSHANHTRLNDLDQFVDNKTYIAIGAKPAMLLSMFQIRDRFLPSVAGVWVYASSQESPDFGMDSDGFFGETAS